MRNISALITDLGPSQKSFYLIKTFNELSRDPNFSCSAFLCNIGVPVTKPLFSCCSVSFFSDYSGSAIATSLQEADTLLKSNNNSKKYLCKILLDKRLNIIARSVSHASIFENFCNKKPVGIVDDWNKDQLLSILEK